MGIKKFHVLSTKKGTKSIEKNEQLQKIDDGIVSWSSKQKEIEKQRLMKEEAAKKKREAREQQIRERKEKKQEMEKIKKQKAEQRQKEKEAKLKKENDKKLKKQSPKKSEKKKRKPSFMDKWVKVTKYIDSSNKNATPIITDKTISISSNNESLSLSPSLSDNRSLYEQIFHTSQYKKSTIVAPILPFDE